jgi:hypothetical protein
LQSPWGPEDGKPGRLWDSLLEELYPLGHQLGREVR